MRPLELQLEGFTSFKAAQRVDFTPLDLFAITGPTGAGKSSLLDAMTFALYGLTLRSGKIASEVVSQGATALKVSFRFAVRGHEYRATRTWRYRPSTPETKVLLEKRGEQGWETLESRAASAQKTIEALLGMDFDTFTRVIVLPQGQFDAFLKGDPAKRRELLRQLAGLEIFERMRQTASERLKEAKARREAHDHQLAGLGVPEPERVSEAEAALAACERERPDAEARAEDARRRLEDETRLGAAWARLERTKRELSELLLEGQGLEALRQRLEAAEHASALESPHATLHEARAHWKRLAGELREASARSQAAEAEREAARAALEAAAPEHEARQVAIEARERALAEAEGLAGPLASARAELEAAGTLLAERQKARQDHQEALRRARIAREQSERALTALRIPPPPEAAALERAKRALPLAVALAEAERQARGAEQEAGAAREAAGAAEQTKQLTEARLAEAGKALAAAEAEREAAEAAEQTRLQRHAAHAVREGLAPGDDCPVCGGVFAGPPAAASPEAPETPAGPTAQVARRAAQDALRALGEAETEHARRQLAHEHAALAAAERAERAEAARAAVADRRAELAALAEPGEPLPQAAALEAELAAHERSVRAHEAALAERAGLEQALAAEQQKAELAEAASAHAEAARADAEQARSAREASVRQLTARLGELLGEGSLEKARQAQAREVAALRQARQALEGALAQAEARALGAETETRTLEASLRFAEAQGQAAASAWAAALEAAGLTEAEFLAARAPASEQAAWRARLTDFATRRAGLEATLVELGEVLGDRVAAPGAVETARRALEATQVHLAELREREASARAFLAVATEKRAQASTLATAREKAGAEERVWLTLSRDLKADAFQDFVLEHLQGELVSRASALLSELTDQRYALAVVDNAFVVEDHWNGGERRPVRTLSGGETFAASIAMALALSEKLAAGAELGALFLDEGFGTLDPETLESVANVLETLRQNDRMIGVITHVRALGERLPTQLAIQKKPDGAVVTVVTA